MLLHEMPSQSFRRAELIASSKFGVMVLLKALRVLLICANLLSPLNALPCIANSINVLQSSNLSIGSEKFVESQPFPLTALPAENDELGLNVIWGNKKIPALNAYMNFDNLMVKIGSGDFYGPAHSCQFVARGYPGAPVWIDPIPNRQLRMETVQVLTCVLGFCQRFLRVGSPGTTPDHYLAANIGVQ